jgi:hypothetical protein
VYLDCDHIIDDRYIYTVRGNWKDKDSEIYVKPVYRKLRDGRYKKIVDVKGRNGENMVWVNPLKMVHVRCRGINLDDFDYDTIWGKIIRELVALGIDKNDIGIFGSKRLDFTNIKDVDFIVYGYNNMLLIKENMEAIKKNIGLYNHTIKHAKYQAKVHGKYYSGRNNNLILCLLNKWSTCAFTPELTTTIRFVNPHVYSGKLIKQMLYGRRRTKIHSFTGVVSDSDGASFIPRTFTISNKGLSYKVFSTLWIFHQCVKNNDLIKVSGFLRNDTIILERYEHGIRFI